MNALEVTATFNGGYSATVDARGHTLAIDEPEEMGGADDGVMPTELLAASLAGCFALALGHVSRRDGTELPGLRVDVRAERAGRELRYGRLIVTAHADVPAPELAAHVERAKRLCWVSNTLSQPPEIEYRATEDSCLSD